MNIVNFTPYSALTGGIIIGFAVAIFIYFNGRLVGISGIASNALTDERNKLDNILFLIGLIIGPIIYALFKQEADKYFYFKLILITYLCRTFSWNWNKNKWRMYKRSWNKWDRKIFCQIN